MCNTQQRAFIRLPCCRSLFSSMRASSLSWEVKGRARQGSLVSWPWPWCRKGHNIATAARSANVPSQRQRAVSALRCSCGANVQHRRQRAALAPMCYHSTNVSHSAHWQSGRHSVQSRRQCEALAPMCSLGSDAPSSISPQAFADCSSTRAATSTTRASLLKRSRVRLLAS